MVSRFYFQRREGESEGSVSIECIMLVTKEGGEWTLAYGK
jgi:hypothetical protein